MTALIRPEDKLTLVGDITGSCVAISNYKEKNQQRYADIGNVRHRSWFGIKEPRTPVGFGTAPLLTFATLELAHEVVRTAFELERMGVRHGNAVDLAVKLATAEGWLDRPIAERTLLIDSLAALEQH